MGSMFKLTYNITLRNPEREKEMIDKFRLQKRKFGDYSIQTENCNCRIVKGDSRHEENRNDSIHIAFDAFPYRPVAAIRKIV